MFDKLPRYDDVGLEYSHDELEDEKGSGREENLVGYLKDLFARHAGEVALSFSKHEEVDGPLPRIEAFWHEQFAMCAEDRTTLKRLRASVHCDPGRDTELHLSAYGDLRELKTTTIASLKDDCSG